MYKKTNENHLKWLKLFLCRGYGFEVVPLLALFSANVGVVVGVSFVSKRKLNIIQHEIPSKNVMQNASVCYEHYYLHTKW